MIKRSHESIRKCKLKVIFHGALHSSVLLTSAPSCSTADHSHLLCFGYDSVLCQSSIFDSFFSRSESSSHCFTRFWTYIVYNNIEERGRKSTLLDNFNFLSKINNVVPRTILENLFFVFPSKQKDALGMRV